MKLTEGMVEGRSQSQKPPFSQTEEKWGPRLYLPNVEVC